MILPVALLLLGTLIVYSGIHNKTVTDVLRGVLNRPGQDTLGANDPSFDAGPALGGTSFTGPGDVTGVVKGAKHGVPGHPELKPKISQVVNTVLAKFPYLLITSTTSGGHASNSYHYKGEAADLAGPNMDAIGRWIAQNMGTMLTEGIHNPTLSYKNGLPVAPSFWGAATWAEHTNHIHLAVAE